MSWAEFLDECCGSDIIYYIDLEYFKSEMQLDFLLSQLRKSDTYEFHFRVNVD